MVVWSRLKSTHSSPDSSPNECQARVFIGPSRRLQADSEPVRDPKRQPFCAPLADRRADCIRPELVPRTGLRNDRLVGQDGITHNTALRSTSTASRSESSSKRFPPPTIRSVPSCSRAWWRARLRNCRRPSAKAKTRFAEGALQQAICPGKSDAPCTAASSESSHPVGYPQSELAPAGAACRYVRTPSVNANTDPLTAKSHTLTRPTRLRSHYQAAASCDHILQKLQPLVQPALRRESDRGSTMRIRR